MSDQLPSRRRSGSGRHAAIRPVRRPTTRLAQSGIAAVLAVGLGALVINPAASVPESAPTLTHPFVTQAAADFAALHATREEARGAAREDLTQAAAQAFARVGEVRAKATETQLAPEQVAALDQLEDRVDALMDEVEAGSLAVHGTEQATGADGDAGAAVSTPDATPTDSATQAAGAAAATRSEVLPMHPDDAGHVTSDPAKDESPDPLPVADPAALSEVLPEVEAVEDPDAAALREAVLALVTAANQVDAAAEAAKAAAAQAAQRAAWKASLRGFANGRIPQSALCAPAFDAGVELRCDAAEALSQLDAAYAARFGSHLTVTDSYRSYGGQVACRRQKGSLCARPGTSNHGWGVAVDFGGSAHRFGTKAHNWLLANAGAYGWTLPAWAQANGSKPEPWHWEYVG